MYPNKLNVKVGTNKYILKIYINKKIKKWMMKLLQFWKKLILTVVMCTEFCFGCVFFNLFWKLCLWVVINKWNESQRWAKDYGHLLTHYFYESLCSSMIKHYHNIFEELWFLLNVVLGHKWELTNTGRARGPIIFKDFVTNKTPIMCMHVALRLDVHVIWWDNN